MNILTASKHGDKICREQERAGTARKLKRIEEMIHFRGAEWRRGWLTWEKDLQLYTTTTGSGLTDDVKIAIVRRQSPEELHKHLLVTAVAYEGKYDAFREVVEVYWRAAVGGQQSA